jgi:hypothetical protein
LGALVRNTQTARITASSPKQMQSDQLAAASLRRWSRCHHTPMNGSMPSIDESTRHKNVC